MKHLRRRCEPKRGTAQRPEVLSWLQPVWEDLVRALTVTLAAFAFLAPALPAAALTCPAIPAAQGFVDKLHPGPNPTAPHTPPTAPNPPPPEPHPPPHLHPAHNNPN